MANIVFFSPRLQGYGMIVLAEKTMEALKCKTGSQGPSSVLSLHRHSSNALHPHNTAVNILQSAGLNIYYFRERNQIPLEYCRSAQLVFSCSN